MKTIGAARFKEQCLALPDQLDAEGLVVTRHGRPAAHVIPCDRQCADQIGSLPNKVGFKAISLPPAFAGTQMLNLAVPVASFGGASGRL